MPHDVAAPLTTRVGERPMRLAMNTKEHGP